ncbi:MucR family transcriptional regulator [Sphingomonas sp. SAFR-052]|uniref:MucR family transcriptional regulator n=1 Tax=Sphingomonas sp. SAFR-052 TaxID=3436867 RepID=UPI003F7E162B
MTEMINTIELATELTVAWLGNSNTRAATDDVLAFLQAMHETLVKLETPDAGPAETEVETDQHAPAVSARKSLASPDYILSMIDGKPYRTLRRHLSSHGLTPDEYRQRYNLKADYPMVAPSYSETRRTMANKIGLGRRARAKATEE